jgi:protein O-mannosyl-transferase
MRNLDGIRSSWETISKRNLHSIHIVLIALAVVCAYANSLDGQFVMDDEAIFSIGPRNLRDILLQGGPRRIANFTFALNYLLHGPHVTGYHLVNLAVHLFACITLYFFVSSSMSALRLSFPSNTDDAGAFHFLERFIPFSAALLFAVHPVQTQAVTYIIQRYTSMATLFYLLTALLYIRARIAFETSPNYPRPLLLGGAAVLSGILAVGSKQIAFTLPLMLFILEIFLFKGRLINRRFLGILGLVALTLALMNWHDSSLRDILFDLQHGTSEDRYAARTTYFLTQSRVVVTYLRLLCLPINQSIFYDYPLYTTLLSLPVAASFSVHILIISLMAILFRLSGQSLLAGDHVKGALPRLAALGIAWFYIAMAVESSIFPITDIIFEHRIYLPSAGFFLTTSAGVAAAVNGRRAGVKTAWSLLLITTFILGGMTIARNQVWGDTLKLWQDTVNKAPNQYLALSNLGIENLDRHNPDAAIRLFVRALELRPELDFKIKVYLGEALQETHLIDESRFTTGKEYLRPNGGSSSYKSTSVMFNNLGLAYEYLGSPESAIISYTKSLRVNPAYDLACYNLGLLSAMRGNRDQAASALSRLKSLNPSLAAKLSASMLR